MLQSLVAGLLLLPLVVSLVTALMQSRPSRTTEGARSVRGTEGDLRTSQDFKFTEVDTIIASRGEHDSERRITHVSQRQPVTKPNDGTGLTSSGPRPLILGTFQITTPRSNASPGSRPPSSSSRAARSPTTASARWSSYTSPLTPRSQLPSSPVSDEVESLKTQLAASEALVKQLTKEKFEAVDASRKLFADVESLQSERTRWMQEREVLRAKLGLLDEVEVSEVGVEDDDALERIGSIFLTSTPADDHDGCGSGNAALSPASTPMAPHLPAIDPAYSSLPYLSPQLSLNALGLFCPPDSPVQVPIPPPARSAPAPAQVLRTQPDSIDLASQIAGTDLCPGHVGHRDLDNRAKSFPKEVKASAGSRPSISLTTGLDSRAATTRVSNSTGRPRVASASTNWLAVKEPQIRLASIDSLRESASKIDGERQTSRRRFTTDKGSAARVGSKSKRPSPLRARNFKPCSSPLANPPLTNPYENPEEEQAGTEMNGLSSSPLVNLPENTKQGQPKKRRQLGKLLKKVRSWISRSA